MLSIVLYSDVTTCDTLGKTSKHPVFLTLDNILGLRHNKPDAKALLAYLPIIEASDDQKKQLNFASAKHYLFHHSMEILVESIKLGSFDLHTDNGILWCYPFLTVLLGDLPEHHTMTLTFNSPNCKMPCHMCTTPKDEFNNPLVKHCEIRTPETMKHIMESGLSEEYSLHKIKNPFWKLM